MLLVTAVIVLASPIIKSQRLCITRQRFKMAEKMSKCSENDHLVFLANVVRERRRRQLSVHLLLQNLVAKRRRVLIVALLQKVSMAS